MNARRATDMHDIRAQLREAREQRPRATEDGRKGITFWIVAVGAVIVGFAVVLLTPRIYSVQRTAQLPSFQETRDRIEAETRGPATAPPAAPASPASYTGKNADEMGKIADDVCFARAQGMQPHPSKTPHLSDKDPAEFASADGLKYFEGLLNCLVTEAPARYCSVRQRQTVAADIASYFRGVEQANIAANPRYASASSDSSQPPVAPKFAYDPKVLSAIEGLIRAGYLTSAERSSFGALAPPLLRDRLARVVANVSPCPKPPWWMNWK